MWKKYLLPSINIWFNSRTKVASGNLNPWWAKMDIPAESFASLYSLIMQYIVKEGCLASHQTNLQVNVRV